MKYILSILLIGFLLGCSDNPTAFSSEEIEGKVTEETLEVFNKLDRSIYYFVVERGTAATILWAPTSGEDNEIKRLRSRAIKLDDIFGFEPGKEILFYYWSEQELGSADIKNIVIQSQ